MCGPHGCLVRKEDGDAGVCWFDVGERDCGVDEVCVGVLKEMRSGAGVCHYWCIVWEGVCVDLV